MRSKSTELMEKMRRFAEEYAMHHNGAFPSTSEIGSEFSINKSTVSRYMTEMNELGMIRYDRGLTGTTREKEIQTASLCLDVLGSIPCGTPEEREASVEATIAIPDIMLNGLKGDFYLLRASKDSMKDAGIDDGDLVLIHQQEEANEGDIVVALVDDGESTLKRLKRDENGICYLWAENNEWEEEKRIIRFENLKIQGVAISAIKNLTGGR